MGILNIVNRNVIFAWKLVSLGIAIGGGYATIAHFTDQPVFGIMYCLTFLDSTIFYCLLYGRAFQIPILFRKATALLLLRVRQQQQRRGERLMDMSFMMRRVRAIQPVGIKVGDFHIMERTSTPVFLHYVLTNVVSLLLAYS